MLGNDVVDLNLAAVQSNWQRKGFIDKICSADELALIGAAHDPYSFFWRLWTMKEACYKLINRRNGIRLLNPRSYVCSGFHYGQGTHWAEVRYDGCSYPVLSSRTSGYIHSIALSSKKLISSLVLQQLTYTPDYLEVFNRGSGHYQLRKSAAGLPNMVHKYSQLSRPASISHHGKWLMIVYSGFPQSAG